MSKNKITSIVFSILGVVAVLLLNYVNKFSPPQREGWTTYTNNQYGFQLDFPMDLLSEETTVFDEGDVGYENAKFKLDIFKRLSEDDFSQIFSVLVKDAKYISLEEELDFTRKVLEEGYRESTRKLNNVPFTIFSHKNPNYPQMAFTEHNGFLYEITFFKESEDFLDFFRFTN